MSLRVKQIYSEISKKGKYKGFPTTFVELSLYKLAGQKRVSISYVLNAVNKMRNRHVCLTGVKPLAQEETLVLAYELVDKSINVCIETDCSELIEDARHNRSFTYSIIVHGPKSEEFEMNLYENLAAVCSRDEIVFSINDIDDYIFAKETLKKYPTKAITIFRPENSEMEETLVEWIIEDKPFNVRIG